MSSRVSSKSALSPNSSIDLRKNNGVDMGQKDSGVDMGGKGSGVDMGGKGSGVDMGGKTQPSVSLGGIGVSREVANIGGVSVVGGVSVEISPIGIDISGSPNYEDPSKSTISIAAGAEAPGGIIGISGGVTINTSTGAIEGGSIGGEALGIGVNVSKGKEGIGVEVSLQIPFTPIEISLGFEFPSEEEKKPEPSPSPTPPSTSFPETLPQNSPINYPPGLYYRRQIYGSIRFSGLFLETISPPLNASKAALMALAYRVTAATRFFSSPPYEGAIGSIALRRGYNYVSSNIEPSVRGTLFERRLGYIYSSGKVILAESPYGPDSDWGTYIGTGWFTSYHIIDFIRIDEEPVNFSPFPPFPNPPPRKNNMDECCRESVKLLRELRIYHRESLRLLGRPLSATGLGPLPPKGFLGEAIERIETPLNPQNPNKKIKIEFTDYYQLAKYFLDQLIQEDVAKDPRSFKRPRGFVQNPDYQRDSEESL